MHSLYRNHRQHYFNYIVIEFKNCTFKKFYKSVLCANILCCILDYVNILLQKDLYQKDFIVYRL